MDFFWPNSLYHPKLIKNSIRMPLSPAFFWLDYCKISSYIVIHVKTKKEENAAIVGASRAWRLWTRQSSGINWRRYKRARSHHSNSMVGKSRKFVSNRYPQVMEGFILLLLAQRPCIGTGALHEKIRAFHSKSSGGLCLVYFTNILYLIVIRII